MQRKHFELIADVLRENAEHFNKAAESGDQNAVRYAAYCNEVTSDIANQFARALMNENMHFDRERFLKACGVKK